MLCQPQVLLRKGGIKEPRFTPRAPAFVLFETSFHTDADLLKPGGGGGWQGGTCLHTLRLVVVVVLAAQQLGPSCDPPRSTHSPPCMLAPIGCSTPLWAQGWRSDTRRCGARGRALCKLLWRIATCSVAAALPPAALLGAATTMLHFPQLLCTGVVAAQVMASDPKSQAQLRISCVARVTGAWATPDARLLAATDPLHVWGPAFLDQRLKWRPTQPVTLLELRCYRLRQPLILPSREEYWGCFSWVDLDQQGGQVAGVAALLAGQEAGGLEAALDDAAFGQRQALLRERLEGLDGVEALDVLEAAL